MKLKTTGKYVNASLSLDGKLEIVLQLDQQADSIEQINQTDKEQLLSIEIKPYRKPRSLDANALLWACLRDMQEVLGGTTEQLYKIMVRRYGKYEPMSMKKIALKTAESIFRVVEVKDEYTWDDERWIDCLCYFGSSTYDSKEMSVLLEGVIDEMHEIGIQPPPPKSVQRGLELWEKRMRSQSTADSPA